MTPDNRLGRGVRTILQEIGNKSVGVIEVHNRFVERYRLDEAAKNAFYCGALFVVALGVAEVGYATSTLIQYSMNPQAIDLDSRLKFFQFTSDIKMPGYYTGLVAGAIFRPFNHLKFSNPLNGLFSR